MMMHPQTMTGIYARSTRYRSVRRRLSRHRIGWTRMNRRTGQTLTLTLEQLHLPGKERGKARKGRNQTGKGVSKQLAKGPLS